MAIKQYLFRADDGLFDIIEQIRSKLNLGTTKSAIVFLINSGVASVCMQHGIQIQSRKEAIITIPKEDLLPAGFLTAATLDTPTVTSFKLVDEPIESEEEVTVEEG